MNDLDLHEQRREILGRRALERLRRRVYHCPHCGYQGSRMDCPRCEEVCESASRRPS